MVCIVSSQGHICGFSKLSASSHCAWLRFHTVQSGAKFLSQSSRPHVDISSINSWLPQKPALGAYRRPCRSFSKLNAAKMTEDLVTELAALETSFEALKDKLKFEDSTRSEIEESLFKVVEELKVEQEAWVLESEKINQVMAQAAKERTSDRDLQLMKEKRESLQKRIEVTSALINEREREISSLEAQLENVKTMGEMKSLKAQPAKQLIEAGATVSSPDRFVDLQQTRSAWVSYPSQRRRSTSSLQGRKVKAPLPQAIQGLFSPRDHTNGMELPGIVLASAIIGGAELAKTAWGSVKTRLSPEVGASIEIFACCASVVALGSVLGSG